MIFTLTIMQDPSPVQDKGPPKSITVEDSFKDCSSLHAAEHVIKVLAPDLLARMAEDYQVCRWYCRFQHADGAKHSLVNLPARVLIRSCELPAFALFDLRIPAALCDNSCCIICSGT